MPLTGQAKTNYQRDYMRRRRSNNVTQTVRPEQPEVVRPNKPAVMRPAGLSDNQWAYRQFKAEVLGLII